MRNSDCIKYLACLDRAVKEKKALNCEGCPDMEVPEELGFRKDILNVEHRTSNVEYPITNKEQEKKEEVMIEETKTKVCNRCGEEKSIKEFAEHRSTKDGHEGQCRKCRIKQKKEREQAKKDGTYKDGRKIRQKDIETTKRIKEMGRIIVPKEDTDMVVTVDFKDYPEAYKALEKTARENIRTMSEQLIAYVMEAYAAKEG